ncbi:hypothetical protein ACS0TY_014198 [Phlomoides rotata]
MKPCFVTAFHQKLWQKIWNFPSDIPWLLISGRGLVVPSPSHPSRCGDSFCFGKVIVIYRDTTYRIGEDFSGG